MPGHPALKTDFDPKKDIADQSGKVFLITGGNAGLGKQAALILAAHKPAHIYLSARSQAKCEATIKEIQAAVPGAPLTFLPCDLTDLSSVRQAAQTVLAESDRLDVLMANAGIMAVPPGLTKDGYEIQFGTNHVGHALLIKLLVPLLEKTQRMPGGDARIILLSSQAAAMAPSEGFHFDKLRTADACLSMIPTGSTWMRYGESKLANQQWARLLAKHHPEIMSVSIHPGVVATDLLNGQSWGMQKFVNVATWLQSIPILRPEQGAWNQVWAATTARKSLINGMYYEPVGEKDVPRTKNMDDEKLGDKLWDWTEKELKDWTL